MATVSSSARLYANSMNDIEKKLPYETPTLEELGAVAEMTQGRKVFAPLDGVVFAPGLVGQS